MTSSTFFESQVFTSMGKDQQREMCRTLKKVSEFEERTGYALESGFTREQYVQLFNSMRIRRTSQIFQYKSLLYKYVKYLIEDGTLGKDQNDILESVSIEDLTSVYYFRDMEELCGAVEDAIDLIGSYDNTAFYAHAASVFLTWYGLSLQEITDYRKADVMDGHILIKGEEIAPPPRVLDFFTVLRDSDGFHQMAKGDIFHRYCQSDYLIRTRFKSHMEPIDIRKMIARLNSGSGKEYALEPMMIHQSGIFSRAHQMEIDGLKLELEDPAVASKVFCEDFTGSAQKYKVAHISRIRDYNHYKQLFS